MPDTRPLTADTYCDLRYTDPEHEDGYLSLRRLKFIATGPLADDCALGLQVLAKQGNRSRSDGLYLQDLWARWDLGSGRLTVGQFKPPFGLERLTSDTELATIDRSVAITRLIPNGSLGRSFARDWGVQWDAGSHTVRYAVAMFVGSGANTSPHGVGPLVTGRLTWTLGRGGPHPSPLPGGEGRVRARLGAAASWRRAHELDFRTQLGASAPDAYQHFDGTDLRWEVDLEASAGRATWRAEHLWGAYDPADPTVPNLRADGFYLQLSYAWDPHWEAVLKYEGFDPGAQLVGGHGLRWTTIGLTRWLGARRDRLQLNYVLKHEQTEPVPNDTLLIQYQHFF